MGIRNNPRPDVRAYQAGHFPSYYAAHADILNVTTLSVFADLRNLLTFARQLLLAHVTVRSCLRIESAPQTGQANDEPTGNACTASTSASVAGWRVGSST